MGRWRTQVYSRAPRDDHDQGLRSSFPHEEVNGKKPAVTNMALLDLHKDPNQNGKSEDTRWWNGSGNGESVATETNGANANVQQTINAKNGRESYTEGINGIPEEDCISGVVSTTPLEHPEGGDSVATGNGNGRGTGCSDAETDAENDEDLRCGLGPCTPRALQIFASKQAFLATFCITWVLQGMYYTYFVSVITTIEKLFQFQSKTTGIIMSATEIGQIGSSLLLTYYGGQGHRPKWIAWGMVLFAVSSFTCSMPHFIFGGPYGTHSYNITVNPNHCRNTDLDSATALLDSAMHSSVPPLLPGSSPLSASLTAAFYSDERSAFLSPSLEKMDLTTPASLTSTPGPLRGQLHSRTNCEKEEEKIEQRIHSKITTIVLAIFFISLLGVGMGQTAVCTLGIPYIDDNVTSRESPLYFAITIGVRILGPALGFILGSLCTRLYADLTIDPQITPNDPRWVGAWWLGLVLVSAMLMLASLAMFSFPKRLKTARPATRALRREKKNPSLRDFPKAVKRLLGNDILMCRTASSVLHILPIAGIYTFLPKYLESQFRLPAHDAAMISGVGGILVMGLGIIISGVFILRVKPNARFVAAWIAFTAALYAIGMGILMFIGCPMDDFAGLVTQEQGVPRFEPVCETTCECDQYKFSPICGADGKTYFSACHAGCTNFTIINDKITEFSDCQCMYSNISTPSTEQLLLAKANIGYCDLQCSNFIWYILLFSLFVFIHSTSEVGSMLLILRCVDPRDKAMALGLIQFAIGLFGNVPCPIVYGAIVDSACLVWDMACGKQGACWLYDSAIFRMFYHGTTGAIMLCAFFVDVIVWYKADNVSFADDHAPSQEEELNPIAGKARSETSV